jgi:hypothetical protein
VPRGLGAAVVDHQVRGVQQHPDLPADQPHGNRVRFVRTVTWANRSTRGVSHSPVPNGRARLPLLRKRVLLTARN